MKSSLVRWTGLLLFWLASLSARAQVPDPGTVWRYQLLDGSQIVDDCPVCDRLPFTLPLRGSFDLRALSHDPLNSYYGIENVNFSTIATNGMEYKVTGKGTLQIGGQLVVRQMCFLENRITSNGGVDTLAFLTNSNGAVTRSWPMLQAGMEQTNGTLFQQFHLELNAAPFYELWLSTREEFSAGIWNAPSNRIGGGDLISTTGRAIKRNPDLAARLGIMPVVPDLGLKDIDVLPGGEIAFATEMDAFSESLGQRVRQCDLLTDRGRVLKSAESLLQWFGAESGSEMNAGLDGAKQKDDGQTWFSVQTNFYSKVLGREIQHGDLLSDAGQVVKPNATLIVAFFPVPGTADVGLGAFYVWPGGETWFYTRERFEGKAGEFRPGDLLSDQGYVVYRREELLAAFEPTAGSNNLTMDALYVITDATKSSAAPVLFSPVPTNSPANSIILSWRGEGSVFQLETSIRVSGPFLPASDITTENALIVPKAKVEATNSFFRLRQW